MPNISPEVQDIQVQHNSSAQFPTVIFGTSGLGNLFEALSNEVKLEIVKEIVDHTHGKVFFDSAGKYGAGLALESLASCLTALNVNPEQVLISNKLGWRRTPLLTEEPTFEPGVWKNLKHDAAQHIGYDAILCCYEEGNELLGAYQAQYVSVHDPDEYLHGAESALEKDQRYGDILEAYRALHQLKKEGKVAGVGVGAKDWRAIERINGDVQLDWVMIANSFTIKNHPPDLCRFMQLLQAQGTHIINSAVFHAGFLTGGKYYDYKLVEPHVDEHKPLFEWRDKFYALCQRFNISPASACICFGLHGPGVVSIALNTTNPNRVKENIAMANAIVPHSFWEAMQQDGLIRKDYPLEWLVSKK